MQKEGRIQTPKRAYQIVSEFNTLFGLVVTGTGRFFSESESSMCNAGRAVIIFFILFSVTKLFSDILCWWTGWKTLSFNREKNGIQMNTKNIQRAKQICKGLYRF